MYKLTATLIRKYKHGRSQDRRQTTVRRFIPRLGVSAVKAEYSGPKAAKY